MTFLLPGTTTTLRADLDPGSLSGVNVQTQAAFAVPISGDPVLAPILLKINYDGKRFLPALPALPPGPAVIEVTNAGPGRGALLLSTGRPSLSR